MVPLPVAVEVDQLLRASTDNRAALAFLAALADAEHEVAYLSPALLRRAVEFDRRHADLDLGLADSAVMAVAERYELAILTFDFAHFRAARPAKGFWRLVVDEARYAGATKP